MFTVDPHFLLELVMSIARVSKLVPFALLVFPWLAVASSATSAAAAEPLRLKVMTFNIRYDTPNDGVNQWNHRSDWAADLIRRTGADFVGIQEAVPSQRADLDRLLPEYHAVGISRGADPKKDEAVPIHFRADRWKIDPEQQGNFWLSDTPDKAGSITWGNACPRIVTWARFIENASGRAVYVYNTHFDHIAESARQKSAAMLADHIVHQLHADPVVVTGDLNSGEDGAAVKLLTGKSPSSPITLLDTFRAMHPDVKDVGTFHAFSGVPHGQMKIDYIFVTPGAKVLAAEIVREHRATPDSKDYSSDPIQENHGERYPSDHFPVTAEIEIP
jgi:endonuclease/exonuclease/phosphatase family metal-dependent hydrolase